MECEAILKKLDDLVENMKFKEEIEFAINEVNKLSKEM